MADLRLTAEEFFEAAIKPQPPHKFWRAVITRIDGKPIKFGPLAYKTGPILISATSLVDGPVQLTAEQAEQKGCEVIERSLRRRDKYPYRCTGAHKVDKFGIPI